MASFDPKPRKPRPPLDKPRLDQLALHYVGRFATSRAKLVTYLKRKLRERGWAEESAPDFDTIVERLARLGYVDDAAFASMKARSMVSRGFGERRVAEALRGAGIGDEDGADARDHATSEALASALRFARRRRLGPYAEIRAEGPAKEKALGAFLRAGHRIAVARMLVNLSPGEPDEEALRNEIG